MLPPGLTIERVARGTVEFLVALAQMTWTSLVRPYPWFWLIVVVAFVAIRIVPALRRL